MMLASLQGPFFGRKGAEWVQPHLEVLRGGVTSRGNVNMLRLPSGPGLEDWMTFTFKLERLDGTPADPPSFKTSVLVWNPGDIPLGANRTLQVVRVRDEDAEQAPVLVVQDLA
jgi:hypothetical protein